jgi:hypothetical protein
MRPAKDFRELAEEARTMASEMTTEAAQDTMLAIAAQYDELVRIAALEEAREGRRSS